MIVVIPECFLEPLFFEEAQDGHERLLMDIDIKICRSPGNIGQRDHELKSDRTGNNRISPIQEEKKMIWVKQMGKLYF